MPPALLPYGKKTQIVDSRWIAEPIRYCQRVIGPATRGGYIKRELRYGRRLLEQHKPLLNRTLGHAMHSSDFRFPADLRGGAVVVIQQTAQPLALLNGSRRTEMTVLRLDQPVL